MSETYKVRFVDGPLDGEVRDCELLEDSLTVVLKDYHHEYRPVPSYWYNDDEVWAYGLWAGPIIN